MNQFIYLNREKISVKSISQVFTGKDKSYMANIAICEIYGKITEGENIYLEDIKTNLTARYPKKDFICELQEK